MSDENASVEEVSSTKSKATLFIGIFASILGLSGGFYATYYGLLFTEKHVDTSVSQTTEPEEVAEISFIPVDQIIVSLRPGSSNKHLSFRSQLEVPAAYREDVEHLLPRIIDIMNGYLSALDTADFENPAIIVRLRSQLLRRVQVVAGTERINDLLVMEFVLN